MNGFQTLILVSSPATVSLVTLLCPTLWNIQVCHFPRHYAQALVSVTLTGLVENGGTGPLQAEGADCTDKMASITSHLSHPHPQTRYIQMSKNTSSNPRVFKILRMSPLGCSQSSMKHIIPNRKVTGEWILNTPKDTH